MALNAIRGKTLIGLAKLHEAHFNQLAARTSLLIEKAADVFGAERVTADDARDVPCPSKSHLDRE